MFFRRKLNVLYSIYDLDRNRIIPSLRKLFMRNPCVKYVSVSELKKKLICRFQYDINRDKLVELLRVYNAYPNTSRCFAMRFKKRNNYVMIMDRRMR